MTFRPFAAALAALVVAVSCGGSIENVDTSRSAGGSAGGGAGGSGGASGRAGSSGAGSAGSAGTGDAGGPDCFAEPRSEPCGMGGGFYFDPASETCRSYGANTCYHGPNYFSLQGCLETCPNARPDIDACSFDSDCTLVDRGCCGSCEPVSGDSLIAVNVQRARAGDYRDPCPPIACSPCPPLDELQTTRQYFRAACGAPGKCYVEDIRKTEYTQCRTDADCVLRDGAACCEGCDGGGLVAVNPSVGRLCGENVSCPECASIIPAEYGAQCQSGNCRVIRHVDAGAR
jgi:hypothetical protein